MGMENNSNGNGQQWEWEMTITVMEKGLRNWNGVLISVCI